MSEPKVGDWIELKCGCLAMAYNVLASGDLVYRVEFPTCGASRPKLRP